MAQLKPSPTASIAMSKRLDIGGDLRVIPFLREAVEVISSDPQKCGLCGHKINQLLPAQTLNSFDISLLVFDPVPPIPPSEPTLESILAELPPTVASPSLSKEPAKEPSKDTSKKSSRSAIEGKEEETTSPTVLLSSPSPTPIATAETLLKKAQEKFRIDLEMWKIAYRRHGEDLEDARRHDMAALALLMGNLTPASRTRLTTTHLAEYTLAMSGKSGVLMAKHRAAGESYSFEVFLQQGSHPMELFIAKHMQVYKDLLDVGYTLDEGEVRVNFRKAISSQFLEIFDSITDHVLPLTLEGCYEKARFAAEVIKARKPTLSRVPNHSA